MVRVAVVGGSLAGLEAARALRTEGYTGELVVLSAETEPPYVRPPLSKELLAGTYRREDLALPMVAELELEWRSGAVATALDVATRSITTSQGVERFDGVVIATGAEALRPPLPGVDLGGVHVVRTLADGTALAAELAAGPGRVVVLGGGFIGAEVASTCRLLGLDVTVVDRLAVPAAPRLGDEVGESLARLQRDHGVDLRAGTALELRGTQRVEAVALGDGTVVPADVVVVAVGVRPATGWLAGSGLDLSDGVLCDVSCLAAPGVVAAGDVARWPNRRFGTLRRVEHWDNAIRQGQHAARTLLAGPTPYEPVPWFWSDQFGHKLQLAGDPTGHDELVVVAGSTAENRFCGLYRRGDRVVAAVTLSAVKPFLLARGLVERSAGWAEALAAFDPTRSVPPGSLTA
jgi:NADPH-dependent 2,4-dienoyl-CoA reductase/sulfur reductase-like enzyme